MHAIPMDIHSFSQAHVKPIQPREKAITLLIKKDPKITKQNIGYFLSHEKSPQNVAKQYLHIIFTVSVVICSIGFHYSNMLTLNLISECKRSRTKTFTGCQSMIDAKTHLNTPQVLCLVPGANSEIL